MPDCAEATEMTMSKKIQRYPEIILLAVFISLTFSCANIVAPSGGPKDITPPKVKKSEPPNFSTNFTGKKIQITFDEYVTLEDQVNQIVVSPPTDKQAEFNVKGKSVVVDLPEDLKDSMTYSIYFGESIKDLNEGNPLSGYEFAFSRSSVIDSFSMQGQVLDALTLEPQKGMLIMLYSSDNDSVPMKNKPLYFARSDASGNFLLKNIKKKKYKVFALQDMNADMLYNQPTESIAFADSLLTPQYIPVKKDTGAAKKDNLTAKKDTVAASKDTLQGPASLRNNVLYSFIQPDTNQKLLKTRSDNYRQFSLVFKFPLDDLQIEVTNKSLPADWKLDEYSRNRDTLICWLSDPDLDTLRCELYDKGIKIDTVEIALKKKLTEQKPGKKPSFRNQAEYNDYYKLIVLANVSDNSSLPYYNPIRLKFSRPVAKTDYSKIIVSVMIDSSFVPVTTKNYYPDTVIRRTLNLEYQWDMSKKYMLLVLPGAFTDIYGLTNDSLMIPFSSNGPESYGRLLFNLKQSGGDKPYIVQLLREDKTFIEQRAEIKGGQIVFDNLVPANYRIRIIDDTNRNGKWDEGDYFQKRQPEQVTYFPQLINIRANWDTEYDFLF